jgi:hypothetical protein
MPEPIPAVIDYRVERRTDKIWLDSWGLKDCDSALFLCRVTWVGEIAIESLPIALFGMDKDAMQFALGFLRQSPLICDPGLESRTHG